MYLCARVRRPHEVLDSDFSAGKRYCVRSDIYLRLTETRICGNMGEFRDSNRQSNFPEILQRPETKRNSNCFISIVALLNRLNLKR